MKTFINYIKAISFYFKKRKKRYWYRGSTKEWVLEVHLEDKGEFSYLCRYPHKIKILTSLIWLKYFWSTIRELKEMLKQDEKQRTVGEIQKLRNVV